MNSENVERKIKTKADPYLMSDSQLLELVMGRLELPVDETGCNDLGMIEGAIGALFLGQRYGLRVLRILHSSRTLRQYEQFLGVSFDQLLPQHGPLIDRSVAWWIVGSTKRYWDLVARKISLEGGQARRREVADRVDTAQ